MPRNRAALPRCSRQRRAYVHEKEIKKFLHVYGRALIGNVIDLLDEGYLYDVTGTVGWGLMELDENGTTTDRLIQGLHEDYLEFEEIEIENSLNGQG